MLQTPIALRRLVLFTLPALFVGLVPAMWARSLAPLVHAAAPAPRAAAVLVANPASATAGSTVVLTGANFNAATPAFTPTVTLAFTDANGVRTSLGQTTTSSVGGAFTVAVSVPAAAAAGPAVFSASDVSGTVASVPFDVRPPSTQIAAAPNSGLPGSTATISGTGFAVNEPLTLTVAQGAYVATLAAGAVTTTNTGSFSAVVTIPGNFPAGATTVMAQDRDSNAATTPFTVIRSGLPTVGVTPTNVLPNATITISGANFAANQPVTLTLGQNAATLLAVSSAATTTAQGAFTATATLPSSTVSGTITITATDLSGNTGTAAFGAGLPYNVDNGPSAFYFAEGYTGQYRSNGRASYYETLAILNANPFTATAVITYLIQDSSPVVVTRAITPNATLRESVNADIGPDKIAAALVSSPSRIAAERIIHRTGTGGITLDGTSSLGSTSLGMTFYFAEGYTGISFQEYLTLANPGAAAAHVTVAFAPQAASAAGAPVEAIVVPASGRVTRNIRRDAGHLADKSVGLIVTSDRPIMAERVLYFGDGAGSGKVGSTAKAGIQSVANQYFFAYGSVGGSGLAQRAGDQSYVTILNPGVTFTTVVAQFVDAAGHSLGATSVVVAPGTRQTIDVNAVIGEAASVYATILTAASAFVAEKPQYYGGNPNVGAHPGVAPSGSPAGVGSVTFPDLSLTSALGEAEQQTVFLYNPTTVTVTVAATYYSGNGSKVVTYTLAPNSITTVNVNGDAAGLPAGALGGVFTVTGSGAADSFVATNIANTSDGRSYTGTQGTVGF